MKRFFPLLLFPLFFLSCRNNANKEYAAALTDSTSLSGLTGDSVKLVKTAAIQFKVKNVEQGTRAVSALAGRFGGRVYEQISRSEELGHNELKLSPDSLLLIATVSPGADMTVRVPAPNLEDFLFAVADLGYFTANSSLKLDDRSLLYLQNSLKQKARETVLAKPVAAKPSVAGQTQAVVLKDESVDRFISNKSIEADAAYSTVNLRLYQNAVVRREVVANYVTADYDLPFGTRLGQALQNGWEAFLNFVLAVLNLWMFLLLGALGFVAYKHLQSKKAAALPSKS